MSMIATPDFRLYHSNSLEVLAGLLADELRSPAPGMPLLAPDTVLIPQVAMRRWLQATLAAEHGVAANIEFLTPGEFVTRALKANPGSGPGQAVPGDADDLDATGLHWRLYQALADAALLEQPALAQIRAHVQGGNEQHDALKAWALAGELASTFEKYQAWRRDWLLRWEDGADADDPQAILWRRIVRGRSHRARRIQHYLDRFEGAGKPLPGGLPTRLAAFATLNVSPDVLRVVATQARAGTLHFYMPTPTRSYWGDLQTLSERLRGGQDDPFAEAAGENRLLQAWGKAGRDFVAVLGNYEVVHPSGDIPAYADPEAGTGMTLAEGGLRDSLLHRLQGDLHHRRGEPSGEPLAEVRRDDPSLQVHACHTRLRELQVLHDQLRALLEDDRFDPPLQPREIAVLAPDIDPYVPYLEAVFGQRGEPDHLPWALADTSPLAGEPLAEVFLRLLALPLSRFGLHEVLDLLASAPIAEAAGLDSDDFERLHAWLQAAGARWGLDARHRKDHDAPEDDACTWQFALDRLLLGHALGEDGDVIGSAGQRVAAWPELEGGALDALDRLIRLLRVLDRQRQSLGETLPPAQWRDRLLDLLKALLPEEPAQASTRRALDRLRKLIDDFAKGAEQAGFDGSVPADVVRAHFGSVLAQADTRAPLLTGGISFGRMVPMRLLPFRAICVLGLDDGDFPRRDAAAGLNRITAELHGGKRRHGDRSTREDDRFLFLQLFAAAQDVFYLSYLGADPRDGSVREPSVLVNELLDAAAAYHGDPGAAKKALLVRHPLQPFSLDAFGSDGEPRRFSYRAQWHPAAGSNGGHASLAPWLPAPLPEANRNVDDDTLTLDALFRFLCDPAGQFLHHRLQLRLPGVDAAAEDIEPLQVERGLMRSQLAQDVLHATLADDTHHLYERLRARALLPSGESGRRELAALQAAIRPFGERFHALVEGQPAQSHHVEATIDGTRLGGRIDGVHAQGIVRIRPDKRSGKAAIRWGLDWLLANAAGMSLPLLALFNDDKGKSIEQHVADAVPAEQAIAALRVLLRMREQGLQAPLAFAPYTGWAIHNARDEAAARKAAEKQWHGDDYSFSESANEAIQLAFRGNDPFATDAGYATFARNSRRIFDAVLHARAHGDATGEGA